ncbi:tetratricopeptide repeat protein [Croceicoccus ponticola]|uniref:Tetratricopeptide repeat protein n=1 Tax=Croceicoccus ponticola TaxID=2217664 RepID=A0A437GY88_9SPHN|nr:GSCFA domain-containing protein [Croceicoccus ponticola]RVQ67633.1 tetratricopeptide repeat protein [Croceicoccus ponticola]
MNDRISAKAAFAQARANRFGRMLGRGDDNRLEPECWPRVSPSFRFSRDQTFFAMGSCFAQDIARRLSLDGYDVLGAEQAGQSQRNRYTPAAIWQELQWVARILDRDDTVRDADIDPLLLQIRPDHFVDLWEKTEHASGATLETAREARRALYAHFRGAFVADVAIVTLGLIEAWWDEVSRSHVEFDPAWIRLPDRERFGFARLSFADCKHFTDLSVTLLTERGRRVLLTTSPNALARTFTADDVIVANAQSKAVLRAVAGEVSAEHDAVDYFPSYEIATLTRRPEVWDDDLLHVNSAFIARIMQHVMGAYVPDESEGGRDGARSADELMRMANLVQGQQYDAASRIYDANADAAIRSANPAIQNAAIRVLKRQARMADAAAHALQFASLDRDHAAMQADWIFDAASILATHPQHDALAEDLFTWLREQGASRPEILLAAMIRVHRERDEDDLKAFVALVERLAPDCPALTVRTASHLQSWGELARGLKLCRRQRETAPQDTTLLRRLARLQLASGAIEDAITTLDTLAMLEPGDGWTRLTLARTMAKVGRNTEALSHLAVLDTHEPDHAEALLLAARLHWKMGERGQARANARRAVGTGDDDGSLTARLGTILAS